MIKDKKQFIEMENIYIYLIVVLLLIIGSIVSGDFFSGKNLINILRTIALLGIVSVGMAFITYSGNMADLSLPVIMAFSGIITVAALPLGLVAAVILGLLAGMLIGFLNGVVVGFLDANPILWTLAVSFFMEGFMRFFWSNNQIYPDNTPGSSGEIFINIFRISIGPIPLIVIIMVLLFCIGHVVLARTKFGLQTRFIGSSKKTARASGVDVKKIVLINYLIAAFVSSIAGILITSMNKLGVYYLGKGYDFKAVTAVVIGGVMLSGGRGNIPGVLGGVLVIGLLTNIMTFLGVNYFQQNIVTGIVFILVVGIHQYQLRKKGLDYA